MGRVEVIDIDRLRARRKYDSGDSSVDYEFPLGPVAMQESIYLTSQRMIRGENRRTVVYLPKEGQCKRVEWVEE